MSDPKDEALNVDKMVEWAHQRDGVMEVQKAEKKFRVVPYDEVARRLQARPK